MIITYHNHYMNMLYFAILLISILFTTGCSNSSKSDLIEKNTVQSTSHDALQYTPEVVTQDTSNTLLEVTLENQASDLLTSYIKFARFDQNQKFFNHINECRVLLQNVFGDKNPEMILSVKSDIPNYNSEYYFTVNENGEPVYMGYCFLGAHDELYTDGEFVYAIRYNISESIEITISKIEKPIEASVAPDFAEYKNSDILPFMKSTHMYFIRYDDADWEDPEEVATMFYYEDSGLYEAYSVSKQILDLTSVEINDYINRDGNRIYSYLPGENYLVSRQEYEQIKSKTFEILTQVTDEPEISSGWINIDEIDTWLDSLE